MYVLVIGQLNEKDAGPHLSGSTARLKGWGDQGTCSLMHRSSPACRPRVGRSRSRSRSIIGRASCGAASPPGLPVSNEPCRSAIWKGTCRATPWRSIVTAAMSPRQH